MLTKLTLSAQEETVLLAKKLAAAQGISVSAMFEAFVKASAAVGSGTSRPRSPLVQKARGLIHLPAGRSERGVLEDALLERHGLA